MEPLKLQVEFRISPILDFALTHRTILSPFLKVADISLLSDEQAVLVIKEQPTVRFDIRHDRMIYVVYQTDKRAFEPTGPMLYFFEIFEKFKNSPSFGALTNVVLATWHFGNCPDNNAALFIEKWVKKVPRVEDYEPDDSAVVVEYKNKASELFRLEFGPFKQTDIKRLALSIGDGFGEQADRRKGLLIHSVMSQKTADPTPSTLKKLYGKILEAITSNFIEE